MGEIRAPAQGVLPPRGATALVVGMGRSGVAAAELILACGGRPLLYDDRSEALATEQVRALREAGASVWAGSLEQVSVVITSPGVPLSHPLLAEAAARGLPIWGELELASRHCTLPTVAITGSDGKSTTCSLVAHLFRAGGVPAHLAGNIGIPFSTVVLARPTEGVVVLEVSSYQLESTVSFRPRVAVLLNLAPDHLERHGSMEAYGRAKARIFQNQGPGDWQVINADRPNLRALLPRTGASTLLFSVTSPVEEGACLQEGWFVQVSGGRAVRVLPASQFPLRGQHNLENAVAALASVLPWGLPPELLAEGLRSFRALPHRLEPVGRVRGALYVNDSKATNVHAATTGLKSFSGPVVLLVGGKDKGLDFSPLAQLCPGRVRVAIAFGEAGPRLAETLRPVTSVMEARDLAQAVDLAASVAREGEVVLLSPACSSFDAYGSFEERGEHFKRLVSSLSGFCPHGDETPKNFSR